MSSFNLECFQNEFLGPGASQVDAIVTVCATGATAGSGGSAPSGARTEIIMIDVSGSMSGKKIREAAQAAAAAVDCIDDGVRFALIAGSHSAWRLYPSAPGLRLAVASPDTRREARAAVNGLRAGGGTAIGTWLALAAGLVGDEGDINHAILLTDGQNEGEEPEDLARAIDEASGRFQCDCRGVGTDWAVAELREIATALLGSVDIVAEPDGLVADFTDLMHQSMGREIGNVALRLWTPAGATVSFVKQVSPELLDLSDRGVEVNDRTVDFPTGAWGEECRDYHVSIQVVPGAVGDEMLAGRVTLMADDEVAGQALIRAVWTEDTARSTRINRQVAHYTGQAELAELIQDGVEARRAGDLDRATDRLGRAVKLATESGNEHAAAMLAKVVDVDDAATGRVRIKSKVDAADDMGLDIASTKTSRVQR